MSRGPAAAFLGVQAAVALLASQAAAAPCSPGAVDILWPGGAARFAVEIADSAEERAQGLMFRKTLPAGAGMLFVYDAPQAVQFWMKNTLIPLDMLFFDAEGRLARVGANAVPGDETPVPGGPGIQYVLEIRGGLAARLGIAEGAALRHPAVDPARAAQPCR